MGEFVAQYVLPLLIVTTYSLQLWTGFAVAGATGDNVIVDRRTKPRTYWFAMACQTLVLIGGSIAVLLAG